MKQLDYFFYNKYIVRHILMSKSYSDILSTYNISFISKLLLSFPLHRIEDVDDVQAYNYIYLLKFFFGKMPYFSKMRSYYNLGKWTYSYNVCLVAKNKDIYNVLFYFLNDIIPYTDKGYLLNGIFSKKLNIFYIVFKDLSVFGEKKTNLGLFELKSTLNLKIFLTGIDFSSTKLCLRNMKIYNF